ncbi:EscN/YscN/HrcN family type III secretion system ATPase, partial [Salmonella enterica subsp. enterica serovar Infantis]
PGENIDNDRAMQMRDSLKAWLCQPGAQYSSFDDTLSGMNAFADQN